MILLWGVLLSVDKASKTCRTAIGEIISKTEKAFLYLEKIKKDEPWDTYAI